MVYLPPSYYDSTALYPVLYMHDGNNIFDVRTALEGQEWQMNETVEAMVLDVSMGTVIQQPLFDWCQLSFFLVHRIRGKH